MTFLEYQQIYQIYYWEHAVINVKYNNCQLSGTHCLMTYVIRNVLETFSDGR